jgi:CMP-N,N'-diacetyllegionaminic acid synthase
MIENKTVLAIIPARGGSKGVPRKNIRELSGKPLIAWTIEEAKKSKYIDRLILSSEDAEIIAIAKQWDCEVPFVRPQELAQDETPGIDPVIHAIETLQEKYDYVVLLQATSPLRSVEDIDGCLSLMIQEGATSCVSVTEPDKSPYWMYRMVQSSHTLEPLIVQEIETNRRQDLPKVYALNGAVYVNKCSVLLKTKRFVSDETIGYIMSKEHSLDIDTELDFKFLNYLNK